MVEPLFQTVFVLCIVPLVLAVLWLLGVPYTRRGEGTSAAQHRGSELRPEWNLDGAPRIKEAGTPDPAPADPAPSAGPPSQT
jgi:hypothetical protein